jgi:hypothetical protein
MISNDQVKDIDEQTKAKLSRLLVRREAHRAELAARAQRMTLARERTEPITTKLLKAAGIEPSSLAPSPLRESPTMVELPVRDQSQAEALSRILVGVHSVLEYDIHTFPFDFDDTSVLIEHGHPDSHYAYANRNTGQIRVGVSIDVNGSAVDLSAWVGAWLFPELDRGTLFFNTHVEFAKTDFVQTAGGATANTDGSIDLEIYRFEAGKPLSDWELISRNTQPLWDRHWSSFWVEDRGKQSDEPHDTGMVNQLTQVVQHEPGMAYAAIVAANCRADGWGVSTLYASRAQADLGAQVLSISFGQAGERDLWLPLKDSVHALSHFHVPDS